MQLTLDEAKIVRGFSNDESINPLISVLATSRPDKNISDGYRIVLRNFSQIGERAGCDYVQFVPAYLANLVRMGLCKISEGIFYSNEECYKPLINHPGIVALRNDLHKNNQGTDISKGVLEVTDFGRQFALACCPNKHAVAS